MIDLYVQHRMYLQQMERLKSRMSFEIVPVNLNYQSFIVVTTGLVEYGGKQFVFQTHSCGCGPQPTIWGAYLMEVIPWHTSDLCACFASCNKTKDRQLTEQRVIEKIYCVHLPDTDDEKKEVTDALRSHFGANKEISFF